MTTPEIKKDLYTSIFMALPPGKYIDDEIAPFVVNEEETVFILGYGGALIVPKGMVFMVHPKPLPGDYAYDN